MLLKYFYDKALAHASYLIGCQKSGAALIIDPSRSIEQYLEAAAAEGLRITGAAETHIHADFVSGARELADRIGAKLYLSDEGPAEWKYQYAGKVSAQLLKNGDAFHIGKVKLQVLHTPGHTPESISFVLTDEGGGAKSPMGIFTGDFVFVGSIGRPDLLETAAGVVGSAEVGARQLYRSIEKFRQLPDYLQVWPAHGAGSACGKGLGAIPSSTVGYEKLFNPALQYQNEQEFVDYILSDQPETPPYFAVMKKVNKLGPRLLSELPPVEAMAPNVMLETVKKYLVIDTTSAQDFSRGHVPGTLNIPKGMLAQWAGFLVDYNEPIYLLSDKEALRSSAQTLRSIGIDTIGGYFDASQIHEAKLRTESYVNATPEEAWNRIERGEVMLVDVRSAAEFGAGHIPRARHHFLGRLAGTYQTIDMSKPVIVQCQSGARSAIAASLLQKQGYTVVNLLGGFRGWTQAGLPTTTSRDSPG